jgi:hypothetical protein
MIWFAILCREKNTVAATNTSNTTVPHPIAFWVFVQAISFNAHFRAAFVWRQVNCRQPAAGEVVSSIIHLRYAGTSDVELRFQT